MNLENWTLIHNWTFIHKMNRKEMLELSVYRQGLLTGILNIAFYNRPSEWITVNTGNLINGSYCFKLKLYPNMSEHYAEDYPF